MNYWVEYLVCFIIGWIIARMVGDEFSVGGSSCEDKLNELCYTVRGSEHCGACGSNNQKELRGAGCTSIAIKEWCKKPDCMSSLNQVNTDCCIPSTNCNSTSTTPLTCDPKNCAHSWYNFDINCNDNDKNIIGISKNDISKFTQKCNDKLTECIKEANLNCTNVDNCNECMTNISNCAFTKDDISYICNSSNKTILQPKDSNESFFKRIKNNYKDIKSNGILLSMMFNNISMDGSGSIVYNKDRLKYIYKSDSPSNHLGYIWDTDFIVDNLGCIYNIDAATVDTINGKEGRCEQAKHKTTNKWNREYETHAYMCPTTTDNKNCVTELINWIQDGQPMLHNTYNEVVILKDVGIDGVSLDKGIEKLKNINQKPPSAFIYIIIDNNINKNGLSSMYYTLNLNSSVIIITATTYPDSEHTLEIIDFLEITTLKDLEKVLDEYKKVNVKKTD